MDRLNQTIQRGRPVSSVDAAKANDVLEHFINAGTLKTILGNYRHMCELLHLKPTVFPLFYPKLKTNLNSWKAKALWKKFDARVGHKCYARGKICPNTRVLIIGAGPCGLRTAIEAQLLGAKVVVIEKRDRMSRNNVLHLWPFVIEDLRSLGAKKFFGKFCAGAIDHISIRQLQCILLKAALLLGVEVYTEVSFEKLVEPNSTEKIGWRAEFKPSDHPVSQYEFDVIIGADGKRNTLQGFKRKEFRGKLAIAITANFINKRTEAEARVEEISGVAFIFNQKFFKELNAETGIDLENIVYYKDDTHYFVMTAKKPSLIDKGVIKQDYADTARLLSPDNVDREALLNYAREAADFSTNYQMPDLEFAVNHYGQPDVAMFDFTSMYAAENASKVIERNGYKLFMILVGDSLLEPFWPTGSGCARGFLSALDACWAIKAWGSGQVTPLEVLAERESIYRLLAQTTPENLNKDCKAYTVDPSTRYPNLNKALLMPQQVLSLYDTDDPSGIELTSRAPQPVSITESHRKRRRRDTHLDPNTLIIWIKEQIREYEDLTVEDVTSSFRDGRVLCAILHHYRPDLLDYSAIKAEDVAKNNQLAFDLLEKEIGISPVMTGEDMAKAEVPDYLTMFSYLTQIYDTFRGEIPHIKHPKLKSPSPPSVSKFISFNKPSTTPTIPETSNGVQPILKSKPPKPIARNKKSETNFKSKHKRTNLLPLLPKSAIIKAEHNSKTLKIMSLQSQLSRVTSIVPTMETKKKFDNFHKQDNSLNCNPVKSLEENGVCNKEKEKKVTFKEKLGDVNFSDEKLNLDLDKIKSIQDWITSTSEITDFNDKNITYCDGNLKKNDFSGVNDKKKIDDSLKSHKSKRLRYFDENFKEIDPELISNVSDENQEVANHEIPKIETEITINEDKNEEIITKVVINHNDDTTNTDKASLNDNLASDIIVRCIEEDCQAISVRELQFCSCSNTFFINKPKKRLKIKNFKFRGFPDQVTHMTMKNKQKEKYSEHVCHFLDPDKFKFLYSSNMSGGEPETIVSPELTYDRIVDWINLSDFKERDDISEMGGDFLDRLTDITSVTRTLYCDCDNEQTKKGSTEVSLKKEEIKIEEPTEEVKCTDETTVPLAAPSSSLDSISTLMEKLKSSVIKFPKMSGWRRRPLSKLTVSEPSPIFSITEETDLPEPKEISKPMPNVKVHPIGSTGAVISRYTSNRPKRHAEPISSSKPSVSQERKTKKRRSFEKYDLGGVIAFRKILSSLCETVKIALVLLVLDFIVNHQDYVT